MTSSEIIEELAKAHIVAVYGCPIETLALHGGAEFQLERSCNQVRAVLLRLADLGMSDEMYQAAEKAFNESDDVFATYNREFTASLRALADE